MKSDNVIRIIFLKTQLIVVGVAVVLSAGRSQAANTVAQSLPDLGVVVLANSVEAGLKKGDIFIFKQGNQSCSLPVVSAQGGVATLDSSKCSLKESIVSGVSVEKAMIGMDSVVSVANKTFRSDDQGDKNEDRNSLVKSDFIVSDKQGWSLTGYYSTANEVSFDSIQSSNYGSGTANYHSKGTFAFGVSYADLPKNGLGYMGTVGYELSRAVSTIRIQTNSGSSVYTSAGTEYSLFYGETAAVYRTDKFYLPIGINIGLPLIRDGGTIKTSTGMDLGYMFGAGTFLSNSLSLEFSYRSIGGKVTYSSPPSETGDFGAGYSKGFNIGVRYWID